MDLTLPWSYKCSVSSVLPQSPAELSTISIVMFYYTHTDGEQRCQNDNAQGVTVLQGQWCSWYNTMNSTLRPIYPLVVPEPLGCWCTTMFGHTNTLVFHQSVWHKAAVCHFSILHGMMAWVLCYVVLGIPSCLMALIIITFSGRRCRPLVMFFQSTPMDFNQSNQKEASPFLFK